MPEGRRAGLKIWWREAGSGPRQALLLHCSLAHSGALKGVMGCLSDALSMTAFDHPGHGRSADWPTGRQVQDKVVDVARSFLNEMPGPVDLIGHSFGGTCCLRIAFETPDKVRALTLIEPPIYAAAKAIGAPEAEQQEARDAGFSARLAADDRIGAGRLFTEEWGDGPGWEALEAGQQQYLADRIHLIEGAGRLLNADRAGLLRPGGLEQVTMPVLLIRGDRSPPVIPAVHRALLARLPDVREAVVAGAGHMVPVTHPEDVASLIRTHLGRAAV